MLGKRFTGALLLSTLIAVPAGSAEVPRLLADINTRPLPPGIVDYPGLARDFFSLDSRLLFSTVGSTFEKGEGILWSTDGTAEGTTVVSATICPSPCLGITPVAALRGAVLLRVSRETYPQLRYWRSDGTPAGTFPVTGALRYPYEEKLVPGLSPGTELFYAATRTEPGEYLIWRIDGTVAGTRTVTGIDSGSGPHNLTAWGGRLYFLSYGQDERGQPRLGLWSTDGTTEDALFLSEVNGDRVVPIPSQLLFTAGPSSEDLWGTDGTLEGTRLLHDFPEHNSLYAYLVAVGDVAYFRAFGANDSDVWTSDGTPEGTHPVPGFPAGVSPDLTTIQRLGGRWFFVSYARIWTAGDGFSDAAPLTGCEGGACPDVLKIHPDTDPGRRLFLGKDPAHGVELWITDGTGAGTRRLTDACPGACNGLLFDNFTRVVLGSSQGRAWFLAYPATGSSGELWVTDGTPAGTRRIVEHTNGSLGFLGGRAHFGLWGTDAYSSELWTADGSRSGTYRVATLKRIAPGSDPLFVPLAHGTVLFGANQFFSAASERRRLWKSDGTAEGTALVRGFRGYLLDDFSFNGFTRVGSSYFFTVYREDSDGASLGDDLWRTDGTRSGTRKMVSFHEFAETDLARAWNGKYLVPVDNFTPTGASKCSYWVSDGTPTGTREIIHPLPGVRCPTGLHPFGSRFLFVARKEIEGGAVPQLFASDGTQAGTLQLTNNGGRRPPLGTEFVQLGSTAFFRIYGLGGGLDGQPEVWRTDGTPKGTRRAFNLKAAAHLQVFQGSLYLTASMVTAALGSEPGARGLFRVEDPQAAPVLIAPISPPYEAAFQGKPAFTPMGGRLFFAGSDSGSGGGRELWVTDGTAAGTKRVLDVRPGPDSSDPGGLTAAGNRVFFSADDGVHGRELWVSDGTAGGTHLVWDVNPGETSSNPLNLTVSGDNLFFGADDGETGQEPWVLRLER